MLKGAIFDMDGLLFDTERLVYENWQAMMDKAGYAYSIEDFKQTVGKRKLEVQNFYFSRFGADFPYWEFADRGRERYKKRVLTEGIPMKKGAAYILERCRKKGLKIALATSTSRKTTEFNLRLAGISRYFDVLVCGEDVKNGKPDPEVFLTAASRLGVAPECCAAFEDSVNGILSAYDAGMTTVMVPDYVQPTEELLPKISFLCGDLSESVECLRPLI